MSSYILRPITVELRFAQSPAAWLTDQAREHGLHYLLAHADDGVIWGRIADDELRTSHGIVPQSPLLRAVTLQQCRLFGPEGELLIWRNEAGWRARLVTDVAGNSADWIDEDQILWGTTIERIDDGFALVRDGAQGMRHAVPIEVSAAHLAGHQLRLRVRHYITYNEDGEARISLSRLVQLLPETA